MTRQQSMECKHVPWNCNSFILYFPSFTYWFHLEYSPFLFFVSQIGQNGKDWIPLSSTKSQWDWLRSRSEAFSICHQVCIEQESLQFCACIFKVFNNAYYECGLLFNVELTTLYYPIVLNAPITNLSFVIYWDEKILLAMKKFQLVLEKCNIWSLLFFIAQYVHPKITEFTC